MHTKEELEQVFAWKIIKLIPYSLSTNFSSFSSPMTNPKSS